MNDTSAEIRKMQTKMWLVLPEQERLIECFRMMEESKMLLQVGIRNEFPEISEKELEVETFRRMYRHDFSEEEIQNICHAIRINNKI
jgi:hypothetical protein